MIRLAVVGDSIPYCANLERSDALSAQLEFALNARGHNVTVIDHCYMKYTTADCLASFPMVMKHDPDIVFIAGIGTNDAYDNVPISTIDENLGQLIAKYRAANVTVWLAGMRVRRDFEWRYQWRYGWRIFAKTAVNSALEYCKRPPLYRATTWQYAKKFGGLHLLVANKHNIPFYVYLLAGVRRGMWSDMIHVNPKGVSVMVERIMPFFMKHLDEHIKRAPAKVRNYLS